MQNTQGKRINQNYSESFEVAIAMVMQIISNDGRIAGEMEEMGLSENNEQKKFRAKRKIDVILFASTNNLVNMKFLKSNTKELKN